MIKGNGRPRDARRPLDAIRVGRRFRKELGDLDGLKASIAEVGLLHPVVITPDGRLIAGRRRLEACRALGWREIPVRIVDLEHLVRGEHAENVHRKAFLPSEAVAIARALEPLERRAANERRLSPLKRGGRGLVPPSWRNEDGGEARDKVASGAGLGRTTLERARAVVEAAEREPEAFGALVGEMDRTRRVNGAYRKLQVQLKARQLAAEPLPLPAGPFRVIVADPPWPGWSDCVSKIGTAAYPLMSLDEIKALPVPGLAAPDAVLWLWATNAFLPDAFEIVKAWGFTYKALLTWAKDKMGIGDWLRNQTEHCLLAVRGRPVVTLTNQTTILHAPVRDHSCKPDQFFALAESLCPGSKVELFARRRRPGWVAWGDEVGTTGGADAAAGNGRSGMGAGQRRRTP